MLTLPVVDYQQANGVGRCETVFRAQDDNRKQEYISLSHCVDVSAC